MTAIRKFPNAPARFGRSAPLRWHTPAWAAGVWQVLQRWGQRRAARELDVQADRRALGNPVLARQLGAAAADCRRGAMPHSNLVKRSHS